MAGTILLDYGSTTSVTMTGIEDIDSSQTWESGWTSNSINNSSSEYVDFLISGQFTMESTSRNSTPPVQTRVYIYAAHNTTGTYPSGLFSSGTAGTVGAVTCTDTEERDNAMRLLAVLQDDGTASAVYSFPPTSVAALFGGTCPPYFAIYVTSNGGTTTADFCVSSGTQLYYTPVGIQYT